MSAAHIAQGEAADAESPEQRVYRAFVQALSASDDVVLTAFEQDGGGVRIWTVIDADPADRAARHRIYGAELTATDVAPDVLVDFRLVNQREYAPELLRQMLPPGAVAIISRHSS